MEAQLIEKGILTQSLATVAAMDIYVATTGDDETGDGLVGSPYLTITRAYQDVPYTLRHLVHIHIAAGAYTDWPEMIRNTYDAGGRLSFDGTAAMVDVDAGPYTIGGGAPTQVGDSRAYDVPVVGGGLAVGGWDGLFLELLDGAAAGTLFAVIENDATDVRIQGGYVMAGAGDKFKIVQPGVTVTIPAVARTIDGDADGLDINILAIAGMKLIASEPVAIKAKSLNVPCCLLDLGAVEITGCKLASTYWGSDSSYLDVPAYIANYGTAAVVTDSVGGKDLYCGGNSEFIGLTFLRSVQAYKGSLTVAISSVKNTAGFGIDAYTSIATFNAAALYIEAKSTHGAIRLAQCGAFHIDSLYVQAGLAGVELREMSVGLITTLGGVDANVTNALLIGNGCRASIVAATCTLVGATGAGNAIAFSSGAGNSAYPAQNLEINDALGAQIVGK